MTSTSVPPAHGWLRLTLGLAVIAGFVCGLHHLSDRMTGATGEMIASNRAADREVYAYVYSEVGDIEEFLDDEGGKYGKAALTAHLAARGEAPGVPPNAQQATGRDGATGGPQAR